MRARDEHKKRRKFYWNYLLLFFEKKIHLALVLASHGRLFLSLLVNCVQSNQNIYVFVIASPRKITTLTKWIFSKYVCIKSELNEKPKQVTSASTVQRLPPYRTHDAVIENWILLCKHKTMTNTRNGCGRNSAVLINWVSIRDFIKIKKTTFPFYPINLL